MRYVLVTLCCLIILFLFVFKKKGFGILVESIALFWFKLAVVIVILFIGNIVLNPYGFLVPINLFSMLTITLLGLPGLLCISFLVMMK